MPIYDFKCSGCGHKFTVLVSVSEKDKLTCPKCKDRNIKQVISSFSSYGRGASYGGGGCGTGGYGGG